MDPSVLIALAGFALAATITPGPNNIMVMASGTNFGLRRTVPHLLGIAAGVAAIFLLAGSGFVVLLDAVPHLHTGLKVISVLYLLFLAWKIANAAPPERGSAEGQPLTFLQAAAFQWVNPKVWATSLSAITLYAPERSALSVALIVLVFTTAGFPSNLLWAWMGTVLQRWLSDRTRLRIFNIAMALLLIVSLFPVLII